MNAVVMRADIVPVSHIVKGELVSGAEKVHGRFATPRLDLDQLVWPRSTPGPAFDTPLAEIVDVLEQLAQWLKADPQGCVAQALEQSVQAGPLPRHILEFSYAHIGKPFDRRSIAFHAGTQTNDQRVQGFEAELKKHPKLHLVGIQYSQNDYNTALTVTANILTANPDLKGLFAANESSDVGAVEAVRIAHRAGKVKIIGWDTSPDEVDGVKQGLVSGLISQDPFRMGYDGIKTALAASKGEPVPPNVDTGANVVTKANMNSARSQELLNPNVR